MVKAKQGGYNDATKKIESEDKFKEDYQYRTNVYLKANDDLKHWAHGHEKILLQTVLDIDKK